MASDGDSEKTNAWVDEIFAEGVRLGIILRDDTLDSTSEFDLSGLTLPVARAACRYILYRTKSQSMKKGQMNDLAFITGVGAQHRQGGAKTTALRDYVQEVLQRDFDPSLESTVPKRAQGTVEIRAATIAVWANS